MSAMGEAESLARKWAEAEVMVTGTDRTKWKPRLDALVSIMEAAFVAGWAAAIERAAGVAERGAKDPGLLVLMIRALAPGGGRGEGGT